MKLAFAIVLTLSPMLAPSRALAKTPPRTLQIGAFTLELPSWWDSVAVDVPELADENAIRKYVTRECKSDTGTASTWRRALKIWAIAAERAKLFPVYIGHAYFAGGEWRSAARVFSELFALADTQGAQAEWYRCYLAYNVGQSYRRAHDGANAATWYERAAAFAGSQDDAVRYYAKQSRALAERVRAGEFEDTH
jgi:hypothetical protein